MSGGIPDSVRLMIAVPTMGGIHPILANRLIRWGQMLPGQVSFYFTEHVAPVDRARNQIVEFFLALQTEGKPLTHLLMIDSDTVPEIDAIERLISHDLDVVSGMTPIVHFNDQDKDWEVFDNCFEKRDTNKDGSFKATLVPKRHTGLHEIFRCGAACLLIKREVFDAIDRPFFRFVLNEDGTKHVRSEDIDFCDRVRAAGFKIYADTDVCCTHTKSVTV
jgi:GT2 family glycosyltransferase